MQGVISAPTNSRIMAEIIARKRNVVLMELFHEGIKNIGLEDKEINGEKLIDILKELKDIKVDQDGVFDFQGYIEAQYSTVIKEILNKDDLNSYLEDTFDVESETYKELLEVLNSDNGFIFRSDIKPPRWLFFIIFYL